MSRNYGGNIVETLFGIWKTKTSLWLAIPLQSNMVCWKTYKPPVGLQLVRRFSSHVWSTAPCPVALADRSTAGGTFLLGHWLGIWPTTVGFTWFRHEKLSLSHEETRDSTKHCGFFRGFFRSGKAGSNWTSGNLTWLGFKSHKHMDTYQKCLCHVWWPQGLGVDFLALKLLGLSLQSSPCLVTSASRYPTSGFFSGCTCSTDPGYSEHISYMYIYI